MSKVSILVPIYKTEKFIEKCAVSLFEQTFEDIEYIFVDDCSPDNAISTLEEIIGRYPSRKENIKIIRHEVNKGLASVRNTAIANASGDYVIHIDSDDYIEPDMIELLYDKVIQDKAEVVVCDFFLEWDNRKRNVTRPIGDNKKDFLLRTLSCQISMVIFALIKKDLFIDNNIYSFQGINLGEDLLIIPRLIYFANKVSRVEKPLYHYMQTNNDAYTKNVDKKGFNNLIFVYNTLDDFFEDKGEDYKKALLKGKLKQKMNLLLNSKRLSWNDVYNTFPETNNVKDNSILNKQEKIAFFLVKNKQKKLFIVYKWAFTIAYKLVRYYKMNFLYNKK